MPIPYSNDLRSRAINLLTKDKKTQKQVADIFSVTQATISRWLKDFNERGHCKFKGYNKNDDKIKVYDPSKIKDLVDQNPFITTKEIARNLSLDVTDVTILNYIKRLGLSFKKTQGFTSRETKK
tara:strand:+ start:106 stop:477 length:372 start_codon:yes stop_codon:yes gene_type:complete